jgi:hypothetical protein
MSLKRVAYSTSFITAVTVLASLGAAFRGN